MFGAVCPPSENVVLGLQKYGNKDGVPTAKVEIAVCGELDCRRLDSPSEESEEMDVQTGDDKKI